MTPALSVREKLILVGLFLSKFDREGLKILGFSSFSEACNVIATSLKGKPASIKNYRDEFDPFFKHRKGWHKRQTRQYCKEIMDRYAEMNMCEMASFLKSQIFAADEVLLLSEEWNKDDNSSFAKRLITGQAAENYFETVYATLSPFRQCYLVNTTRWGCGFDYKVVSPTGTFSVVEVKGLSGLTGAIQLTSVEYRAADFYKSRYYLFVVRNFAEKPFHTVFEDPLHSTLVFERREVVTTQVTWSAILAK